MDFLTAALEPLLQPLFLIDGRPLTTVLELIAFVLAVVMVACNIRVIAWGWPLAIVSSLLYFLVFWQSRLYGDAALQIVFAVLALWGWWQWLRGRGDNGAPLRVHTLPAQGRGLLLGAVLVGWPLLGLYLDRYTDTDVPYWDAFPTVASLAGQYLLGRKLVENWPTWIVVNAVSVGLFAYKGLWLTTVLYLVFIVMAMAGWRAWRQLAAEPA